MNQSPPSYMMIVMYDATSKLLATDSAFSASTKSVRLLPHSSLLPLSSPLHRGAGRRHSINFDGPCKRPVGPVCSRSEESTQPGFATAKTIYLDALSQRGHAERHFPPSLYAAQMYTDQMLSSVSRLPSSIPKAGLSCLTAIRRPPPYGKRCDAMTNNSTVRLAPQPCKRGMRTPLNGEAIRF